MTGAAIDDQVAAAGEARPSGYRAALDALGGAQKSADGVPLYTRYVNRWLGKRVAAAASLTRLTPNQVTALSMVSTMAGLALVTTLRPSWPVAVSATALLAAGYVLDSADGQLARLTGTGGPVGEWFDHVVDAARNPLIHLAVAVALFRFSDLPAAVLLLPLAFSVVTTVRYFSQMLAAQLAGRRDDAAPAPGSAPDLVSGPEGRRAGLVRSAVQTPSDPGVINLVFLLLPVMTLFVAGYALLFVACTVLLSASLVRRLRELRGIAAVSR